MFGNSKEPTMIEFERKSAGKSPERRTSAATFGTPVLSHKPPAEPSKLEDEIGLFPDELVDNQRGEFHGLALIPPNEVVPCRRSPQPKPFNTRIDTLEYEISRKRMQSRLRQAIGAGAPIEFKAHRADPSLLLWYAAAVVTGCLGWLFYFVFGALK
jgi:hypothetical protein